MMYYISPFGNNVETIQQMFFPWKLVASPVKSTDNYSVI